MLIAVKRAALILFIMFFTSVTMEVYAGNRRACFNSCKPETRFTEELAIKCVEACTSVAGFAPSLCNANSQVIQYEIDRIAAGPTAAAQKITDLDAKVQELKALKKECKALPIVATINQQVQTTNQQIQTLRQPTLAAAPPVVAPAPAPKITPAPVAPKVTPSLPVPEMKAPPTDEPPRKALEAEEKIPAPAPAAELPPEARKRKREPEQPTPRKRVRPSPPEPTAVPEEEVPAPPLPAPAEVVEKPKVPQVAPKVKAPTGLKVEPKETTKAVLEEEISEMERIGCPNPESVLTALNALAKVPNLKDHELNLQPEGRWVIHNVDGKFSFPIVREEEASTFNSLSAAGIEEFRGKSGYPVDACIYFQLVGIEDLTKTIITITKPGEAKKVAPKKKVPTTAPTTVTPEEEEVKSPEEAKEISRMKKLGCPNPESVTTALNAFAKERNLNAAAAESLKNTKLDLKQEGIWRIHRGEGGFNFPTTTLQSTSADQTEFFRKMHKLEDLCIYSQLDRSKYIMITKSGVEEKVPTTAPAPVTPKKKVKPGDMVEEFHSCISSKKLRELTAMKRCERLCGNKHDIIVSTAVQENPRLCPDPNAPIACTCEYRVPQDVPEKKAKAPAPLVEAAPKEAEPAPKEEVEDPLSVEALEELKCPELSKVKTSLRMLMSDYLTKHRTYSGITDQEVIGQKLPSVKWKVARVDNIFLERMGSKWKSENPQGIGKGSCTYSISLKEGKQYLTITPKKKHGG